MLTSAAVEDEGFVPLKRIATAPPKPQTERSIAVNPETGEKEDLKAIWESSNWAKLEKGKHLVRANSFVGTSKTSRTRTRTMSAEDPADVSRSAVVIVDPFSTGAHLARAVCEAGYKCIRAFSIWDSPVAALIQEGVDVEFFATVQHNDQLPDQDAATNKTIEDLRALNISIIAVIPGAETGVELADRLSHRMGLRSNGEEGSLARRNKYLMGEKVRQAGVRAVKQQLCTTAAEMLEFLKTLSPTGELTPGMELRCVVKPVQSAGSDDVFLCKTVDEAEIAFERILGKRNGLGLMNNDVLVQEFLQGKEYVVDKVSKDGVHKIVAVWEYDKRPVNNASFVYFGMRLMPSDTPKSQELIHYADGVLNALGIMQGPSHMEVMYCKDGPCLVEVGSRCHGGEGSWLPVAQECIGYTVVSVTLDVYTNGPLFDTINATNFTKRKAGREVDMVCRHGGVVRSLKGDASIRALASFRSINWEAKVGDYQPATIDCFTRPGSVQLCHESEEQVEADLEAIHDLEDLGLFDYSVICPVAPVIGAVVVVDPFSTGANLAAAVLKWGYRLIIIFSEMGRSDQAIVSKGTNLPSTLIIQHDSQAANQDEALVSTLSKLQGQSSPVLAILAGAENGVELAERLAYKFHTRNNGQRLMKTRSDKILSQEHLASSGVLGIRMKHCKSEQEVTQFMESLPSPHKVVVKSPNALPSEVPDRIVGEIASSNFARASNAFKAIHGQTNPLGIVNDGAVVSEYVEGVVYIVDAVSRDAEYKVVAVWQFASRDDSASAVDGMRLCAVDSAEVRAVVEYAEKAALSLGYIQGPTHAEIVLSGAGPRLRDIGWRCHGGLGTWLPIAQECIGYSQIDATLNCFLRPDRFDSIPKYPVLIKHGMEVFLHSDQEGTIKDIPGLEEIRELASTRRVDLNVQAGSNLERTEDFFTSPGSVLLVSDSLSELLADSSRIRKLEDEGLFLLV